MFGDRISSSTSCSSWRPETRQSICSRGVLPRNFQSCNTSRFRASLPSSGTPGSRTGALPALWHPWSANAGPRSKPTIWSTGLSLWQGWITTRGDCSGCTPAAAAPRRRRIAGPEPNQSRVARDARAGGNCKRFSIETRLKFTLGLRCQLSGPTLTLLHFCTRRR